MNSKLAGRLFGVAILVNGTLLAQAIQVPIDVKPGDTPTTIERGRGGQLPVAVLSTAQFDALSVDPTTIKVGPTGTEAEPARVMRSDVNDDGRMDLMLLVRMADLPIRCETKVIRVKANTMSGTAVEGSEAVTVSGCEAASPA